MANKIQTFPKHMKVPFTFFCFLIPFSEAVTVTISFCICLQTYLCIFRIYIFNHSYILLLFDTVHFQVNHLTYSLYQLPKDIFGL